jgi:hypothetical protein
LGEKENDEMPSQTLVITAVPNGVTAQKKLRVSLYLSPRLAGGATLSDFKDFLDWPGKIQKNGLKFTLACGAKTATAAANLPVLRPDVWQSIFTPQTHVSSVPTSSFANQLIVSYPVLECLTYLKFAYQSMGVGSGNQDDRSPLVTLLDSLVFRNGLKSTLFTEMSQMRVTMWREQHPNAILGAAPKITAALTTVTPPPDGVPTTFSAPADFHDAATRFALFHHIPQAHNRPPLPSTPAEFAKVLDFHKALTALSSYPALLRALGLVFDIEVPESLCPASPASGTYGSIVVKSLTPGFHWAIDPVFGFPATAYVANASAFQAAPATPPADVSAHNYQAGDVVGGLLGIGPQDYQLMQVDLDGALLKALTLADNVFNPLSTPENAGTDLPSLRSSGIALIANGRGAQLLQSIAQNNVFSQSLASNSPFPRPFNARDLVRGFRIDIYSLRTKKWYSLHRRNATYQFGAHGGIAINSEDEEGFLQPAASSPAEDKTRKANKIAQENHIPQPWGDVFFHERVARWDGWSLSAARPGGALNRSPDPAQATDPDPTMNEPITPFKMTTLFAARAGSLPELRFGDQYRLRARAVDIAGNSLPLSAGTPADAALPASGALFPYLRFEPVTPPLVVPQQPPTAGASLERLVIRSYNSDPSLDAAATGVQDSRHIAPPRSSVRMAEQHGMLDAANGQLRGDANTYNLIVQRDHYELPTQGGSPLVPGADLEVLYLPDPLARGAAFRDLPNTQADTYGKIQKSALAYRTLPDVQPETGSVTFVGFGSGWPERESFRLVMKEGSATPAWDAANRVLTVTLQKAAVAAVALSSYVTPGDLSIMGVWGWIREYFEAQEAASMTNSSADITVNLTSDTLALLTRLALEGGHEMLTPSRTLTLVHAVQQPLGLPTFFQLPVVHQPTAPILASTLANSFTPITAWRSQGAHSAVLLGGLQINAESSAKIDIEASWIEVTDDPSQPAPTAAWNNGPVDTIPLAEPTGPIYANAAATRMVAVYIPKVDVLWFSAPFDELEGVANPGQVAAPVHNFNDTKHRWVTYKAIATSRFQEYFPANLKFTRTGVPLVVDVPSSARPVTPDIAYVVPTFGWEEQQTTNVKSSVRFGNSVRVYLNRPWYSSGQDELLGVVLWPGAQPLPDLATRETYKPYFTQWGNDPIWQTGALDEVPNSGDFPNAVAQATGLTIEETAQTFDVAGHAVEYDQQRGLWFCDIELQNSLSYAPFVRLALARYQTHSIQGVELSRVSLADFVQLAPERSAVVSINPTDPTRARVFVGGLAPQGPNTSLIVVSVQKRVAGVLTDMGWEPAPANAVTVTEDSPAPQQPGSALWSGTVQFKTAPPAGEFRIVVHEYERIPYLTDSEKTIVAGQYLGLRLIYAANVPYDYPALNPELRLP